MSRKIKHIIEYVFVRWIIFTFDLMPYRTALRAGGSILGRLTYLIGGSRRRMVDRNLQTAFPDWSAERRAEMVRGQFRNLGYLATEFVKLPRCDREWMERYVEWEPEGLAFVQKCLDQGRGVMIHSAHFGNWEIIPAVLPEKFGVRMTVIGAKISNPYTHRFVWGNRARDNLDFLAIDEMGAGVVKALRRGELFAIASDQSAGKRGVFVDYFGVPSSTHTGAGQICYLADAEMVFTVAMRLGDGRFRMEFVPLGRGREVAADREEAIRLFTLRYIDILEKYVRKYPEQYFWLHNRWKIKAPADAEIWPRVTTGLEPVGP